MPFSLLADASSDLSASLPGGLVGFIGGGGGAFFFFRLYDRNRAAELERTIAEKKQYYDDRERSMQVVKTLAESQSGNQARLDGIEKSLAVLHERVDGIFDELVRLRT